MCPVEARNGIKRTRYKHIRRMRTVNTLVIMQEDTKRKRSLVNPEDLNLIVTLLLFSLKKVADEVLST